MLYPVLSYLEYPVRSTAVQHQLQQYVYLLYYYSPYLVVLDGVESDCLSLTALKLEGSRAHLADGIDDVFLGSSPLSPLLIKILSRRTQHLIFDTKYFVVQNAKVLVLIKYLSIKGHAGVKSYGTLTVNKTWEIRTRSAPAMQMSQVPSTRLKNNGH